MEKKNVTRNTLSTLLNKVNAILKLPITPYIKSENTGEQIVAVGHLAIEVLDKRYNIVQYTETGIRSITADNSTARELEKFLSGYLLGLNGGGITSTIEIGTSIPVQSNEVSIPTVNVSSVEKEEKKEVWV